MTFKYSFTMLNTFEQCPMKFKSKYITRDPEPPAGPALLKGREVHATFENIFGENAQFSDMQAPYKYAVEALAKDIGGTILTEQKYGILKDGRPCIYTYKDVWFRGIADVVVLPGRGHWTAAVLDWKTGKDGYLKPYQLTTSALLVAAAHRSLATSVSTRLVFVEHDTFYPQDSWLTYTVKDWYSSALDELRAKTESIERAVETGRFAKNRSPLCAYCSSRECSYAGNRA